MLQTCLRILRRLSPRLFTKIWTVFCRYNKDRAFFFNTKVFNRKLRYGGIFGLTDNAHFERLSLYEKENAPVLRTLLEKIKNPVIFDIGSNNGQSLMIFKALCPDSEVHCFEPIPQLAGFLKLLVFKNKFEKVTISQNIVSNKISEQYLYYPTGSTDLASIYENLRPNATNKILVKCCTLDDYVYSKGINHVDLLKIDVESGEPDVVDGAKRMLKEMCPALLMEILFVDPASDRLFLKQQKMRSLLEELGYKFYHIVQDGALKLENELSPDKNYKNLNYFVTTRTL